MNGERLSDKELDRNIAQANEIFDRLNTKPVAHGAEGHYGRVARTLHSLGFDKHVVLAGLYHGIGLEHAPKRALTPQSKEILEALAAVRIVRKAKPQQKEYDALQPVIQGHPQSAAVVVIRAIERADKLMHVQLDHAQNTAIANTLHQVYAPALYQLGHYDIARQMHEEAYKYLYPKIYRQLEEKIRAIDKTIVERYARIIQSELAKRNINARVFGRIKKPGSIIEKARRKGLDPLNLPSDLIAFTIIPTNANLIEGVEHQHRQDYWISVLRSIGTITLDRDFYKNPRGNYKALHLDAGPLKRGSKGIQHDIEIQVKTKEAYEESEQGSGSAARAAYKRTNLPQTMLEILKRAQQADQRPFRVITIRTRDGREIPLPEGATPLDMAYCKELIDEFGDNTTRAHVIMGDSQINIPLRSPLIDGAIVYLFSDKKGKGYRPTPSWGNAVKTEAAREAVLRKAASARRGRNNH